MIDATIHSKVIYDDETKRPYAIFYKGSHDAGIDEKVKFSDGCLQKVFEEQGLLIPSEHDKYPDFINRFPDFAKRTFKRVFANKTGEGRAFMAAWLTFEFPRIRGQSKLSYVSKEELKKELEESINRFLK